MKYGDKVLLKQYKNGNKLWGIVSHCPKCNDTGKVIWSYANHVCFDCDGKGWYFAEEREYTPENLAKREAMLAKRRAEQEAKQAELAAEQARREAERQAEIESNRGHFVGQVGDKIEMTVTLDHTFSYEAPCYGAPWKTDLFTGYVFKTDDGNTLVWKTTGSLARKVYVQDGEPWHFEDKGGRYDYEHVAEGERVTITGTIKDHKEYHNVNQTLLTRVKWIDKPQGRKPHKKYNPAADEALNEAIEALS